MTDQEETEDPMVAIVNWARVLVERETRAIEAQIVVGQTTDVTDARTSGLCTSIIVEVLIYMILVLEVLSDMIDGHEVLKVDMIDGHEVLVDTRGDLGVLVETRGGQGVLMVDTRGDLGTPIRAVLGLEHLVVLMFCQRTMKETRLIVMADLKNAENGNLRLILQRVAGMGAQMKWVRLVMQLHAAVEEVDLAPRGRRMIDPASHQELRLQLDSHQQQCNPR